MKKLFNILLLFLLFSGFAVNASIIDTIRENNNGSKPINLEPHFARVEKDYIKGDYKFALKRAQELLKEVEKNFGDQHLMRVRTLAVIARIYEGLGRYDDYRTSLDLSINTMKLSSVADTILLIKSLEEISSAYYEYGDYNNAEIYINKAIQAIERGNVTDRLLANDIKGKLAYIHYKQGYLNKTEFLVEDLINFRKSRITDREAYRDSKGKLKERKLSSSEKIKRARAVAELMNLAATIALENGNMNKADSLLEVGSAFIKRNIGKKDISYVNNLLIRGSYLQVLKKNFDANNYISKAAKLSNRTKGIKWKGSSKPSLDLQAKLVISLKAAKYERQSSKRKKILETRISRYYGKNSPYQSRIVLVEGQTDLMNKDYKKAEENAMIIINNPSYSPKNHMNRINALQVLVQATMNSDQFLKTEEALDEIADVKEELYGETSPAYKMALMDFATFDVQYVSNFKRAEEIFETGLKSIDKEVDHRHKDYLSYIYGYSKLFEFTDRFEKSLELLDKALADSKKYYGEKSPKYARALVKLSNVYIDLGKYSEAEKNLTKAAEIFKNESTTEDNQDYSEALITYARLNIIQGQYDEARKQLRKAINKQSSGKEAKLSDAIEELATLYIEIGKYQETEKYLKESLKLKEAKFGSVHRTLVNPLNQLGHLYVITGNYIEAEKMLKRAASISVNIFGSKSLKFAESLKLLGDVYSGIGDYEKAEEADMKAIEIQKNQYGPNHIQVAMSLNDLAIIKFYNKAPKEEVASLLNQALSMAKSNVGENHPTYASILYNLGLFNLETGEVELASSFIDKANAIWIQKFGENNRHSAQAYLIKGNIAYTKGDYNSAKSNYINSKSIYSKIFDNMHPGYLIALGKEGQMDYIIGDNKGAVKALNETTGSYINYIKKYFPSLSEKEKTKFWNKIQKDFEFYQSLAIKLKDQNNDLIGGMYNNALATKAVLLNSSIKVRQRILESKDPILIDKFENWIAKKELLTSAISMTAEQRKESDIDIKVLESEIESLEKELSSRSEIFAKSIKRSEELDWKNVKKNLLDNEVAVEIVRFRWFDKSFTDTIFYAALIVTPDTKSSPDVVLFKDGYDMEEKWLKYYRNCMRFALQDKHSYEHFWKPIREKIKPGSVVYFSADGVYNQINLETILTDGGKYVIDENEIVLVSNTKDIISRKLPDDKSKVTEAGVTPDRIALFGNPLYYTSQEDVIVEDTTDIDHLLERGEADGGNKISQLPGAEQEVRNLDSLLAKNGWKSEAFLSEQATEGKLKALGNIKVFHIATHGFFLDNQTSNQSLEGLNENRAVQNPLLRSGLLLKDGGHLLEKENIYEFNSSEGILTAYEAMNLNFDNCDLVVLSACETGLGKVEAGEGVFGLQRAFLMAGAETVVMSLFKVNDEVTQDLMIQFYKNWIQTGDKRKSFLTAKKFIKEKYKKPIYWGSFIMIGMP